jgi:CRP-like cAMP-binding protein
MQQEFRSILAAVPLFKDLDKDELNQLIKLMSRHTYSADQLILAEGLPSERLIVLLSGTVSVVKGSVGLGSHLCDLGAGECIGETGVLERAPCSANVVASGRVETAAISSDDLERYFGSNRLAAIKILRQMVFVLSERLRRINLSYSSLKSITDAME